MKQRVVITGLGTYNPLGHDPDSTWKAALEGRSGIRPITAFDTSEHRTTFAGEVREFDPVALFGRRDARRLDRTSQLALAAANQAIEDARLPLSEENGEKFGVILGTGVGNIASTIDGISTYTERGPGRVGPYYIPMMLSNSPSAVISINNGLRGPNLTVATACATSNNAIGEAAMAIQRGAAEVMLAGGAEAAILPVIIAGFNSSGALSTRNDDPQGACRPFDAGRDGFVAGEGAAILILESLEHALSRGARVYAEFLGYGTSADAFHISAPDENGDGAARAMKLALEDAGLEPEQVDYINAHGTSTALNDLTETLAIKRVFGERAYDIPVSSTKSTHGHLLGAAGALEALLTIKAIGAGIVPPTINYHDPDPACDLDYVPNNARKVPVAIALNNSFGFGGHNASIVLGRFRNGAGE